MPLIPTIASIKTATNNMVAVYSMRKLVWTNLILINEPKLGVYIPFDIDATNVKTGIAGTIKGGAPIVTGFKNNAISLDGTDSQFVDFGDLGSIVRYGTTTVNNGFSFGCRIKPASLKTEQIIMGLSRNSGTYSWMWDIRLFAGNLQLTFYGTILPNNGVYLIPDVISAGEWYSIAVVLTNASFKVFINDVLVLNTTGAPGANLTPPALRFMVGAISASANSTTIASGKNFHGLIDDVWVMNKRASDLEVSIIHQYGF